MHVQIINFSIEGITEEEYRGICDAVAPKFAAVPGLIAKVWLADASLNRYGGVYLWSDRESMEQAATTELFQSVAANPHFVDLTSRGFAVLDAPTEVTRGLLAGRVPA
jgi:hypothetical protein